VGAGFAYLFVTGIHFDDAITFKWREERRTRFGESTQSKAGAKYGKLETVSASAPWRTNDHAVARDNNRCGWMDGAASSAAQLGRHSALDSLESSLDSGIVGSRQPILHGLSIHACERRQQTILAWQITLA
jgi:hypothetical protein